MYDFAVGYIKTVVSAVTRWFTAVYEATGLIPLYISAVCIVFSIGFIVARFGPAISMGSDKHQDEEELTFARRGPSGYLSSGRRHKELADKKTFALPPYDLE